jgi:hypothetical protein
MKRGNLIGLLLIVLGVCALTIHWDFLGNLLPTGEDPGHMIGIFWPTLFVIPFGLLFHLFWLLSGPKRGTGLLIPGGILTVGGVFCQISMLYDIWGYLWPGVVLAVAFGLLEFYLFGSRNPALLIPVTILGATGIVFFAMTIKFFGGFLQAGFAVLLIVIGVMIMFRRRDTHHEGQF